MTIQNKRTLIAILILLILAACVYGFTAMQESISIKNYVDMRFEEMQKAIDKAYSNMENRLAGMNEFRATLQDANTRFISRAELDAIVKPMNEERKALQRLADIAEGKASQSALFVTMFFAFAGFVISVFKLYIDKKK